MSNKGLDKVRASRDGHQYHEAWLARRALGLLSPRDQVCGIAIEGLSVEDQDYVSDTAIEVADATFYFGAAASFEECSRLEITQFKYSIGRADDDFRFADAKKTLKKFASAEADFAAKHGQEETTSKLRFSLVTNRPISPGLREALEAVASGTKPQSQDALRQYDDLIAAIALVPERLKDLVSRISVAGRAGVLRSVEQGNTRIIADWSASNDALARARLGDLRELIRDKAGHAGQGNNLVSLVDVLAALGLGHEDELLPTPQAFPDPGVVVERMQLGEFIGSLGESPRWIVHAPGGVGKTVFAESAAKRLRAEDEVVLFDCFGGGAYRSPTDGRHRPERGLLHIVNELACRGLCDPILPGSSDPGEVIRRSLQRFSQAVASLRRTRPAARIIVIVDAADNAAIEARDRNQPSFPKDLLESLSHQPVEGLVVVATARTERREDAIGRAVCAPFPLLPFSPDEARAFIAVRRPEAAPAQVEALFRRSDGNPRVLANLIEPDRPLVGDGDGTVDLPTLIEERIDRAVKLAYAKGSRAEAVSAFLCALSVLPPPVPIKEMALAFGIPATEVESFAADLSPLLERTRHGLIFRDEPTETLVRTNYGSQLSLLNDVVTRLTAAQASSIYAARALPGLLFAMNRVAELRALAFDTRFPAELDSEVAKHGIRISRLRTALGAAARAREIDAMVDLLVELSTIAAVEERGEDYLLSNPDLVVALGDQEALRRLFEVRGSWAGTRHARLAIAYTTDADTGEAYAHVRRADEWLRWYRQQDQSARVDMRQNVDDYASIPFYLLAKDRTTNAARFIGQYVPAFGYNVVQQLFDLCTVATTLGNLPGLRNALTKLVRCPKAPPALIAGALTSFPTFDRNSVRRLLQRLAAAIPTDQTLHENHDDYRDIDSYRLALLRCAMKAAQVGLAQETEAILAYAAPRRHDLWSLNDPWPTNYIAPWLLMVSARAAATHTSPNLFDCLPGELFQLVRDDPVPATDAEQKALVDQRLKEESAAAKKDRKQGHLSDSDRYHAGENMRKRILPLVPLARDLTNLIATQGDVAQAAAVARFIDAWKAAQTEAKNKPYRSHDEQRYFDSLYDMCALQSLTVLGLLNSTTAAGVADCIENSDVIPSGTRIAFVRQLAANPDCHQQAGRVATGATKLIELEDNVESRSSLFARLARAILPANRSEATLLFKQGLTVLDAIGSGDYAFTNELLLFAASCRKGVKLSSPAALRLAKICELNNYDSHKFPWPLTGKALARVWGLPYLAQISRWHDRDKADLELTLPSALTFLVRDGLILPEDAISALGLVDPIEMWDWGWHDFITSLIDVKPPNLPSLLNAVFDAIERANPTTVSEHRLKDIRTALEKDAQAIDAVLDRLTYLESRRAQTRRVERSNYSSVSPEEATRNREYAENREKEQRAAVDALLVGVDPTSVEAIEILVDQVEEVQGGFGGFDLKFYAFDQLRDTVRYGQRDKYLKAIGAARNLNLYAKSGLLQSLKKEWQSDSPTRLAVSKDVAAHLVDEHAAEIMGTDWGFSSELRTAAEICEQPLPEIAIRLVEAATTRDLVASAPVWMNLATLLSDRANADTPTRALERLLDSGAARLADEIGDGHGGAKSTPATTPSLSLPDLSGSALVLPMTPPGGVQPMWFERSRAWAVGP